MARCRIAASETTARIPAGTSDKRRSSTRRRSGRDVRLPRPTPCRRVPSPSSSKPFPDALRRVAASLRTRVEPAHLTGRASVRETPAGRARNGKRGVSSTWAGPPNDGLATDLARSSPRAASNVEWALEKRVRCDAPAGVVKAVSRAGRAGGEVCRFANTLLTAGAELQRQQAEAATRSTHERPAQLPFLPLPAVRTGPVKVGSSPPSDTTTRCSPCSEHVDKFETDLNPHGFPRTAW